MMIKKYISHSGITIEVGDFYGGGQDHEGIGEVVTSLEESDSNLRIYTSLSSYDISLKAGDYLGLSDGSGKLVKAKNDPDNDNL